MVLFFPSNLPKSVSCYLSLCLSFSSLVPLCVAYLFCNLHRRKKNRKAGVIIWISKSIPFWLCLYFSLSSVLGNYFLLKFCPRLVFRVTEKHSSADSTRTHFCFMIPLDWEKLKKNEWKYHGYVLQIKNKDQQKAIMIKYTVEALAPLHSECSELQTRSLLSPMNLYLHEILSLIFLPFTFSGVSFFPENFVIRWFLCLKCHQLKLTYILGRSRASHV